ncbi:MAG: 50S ribosomal protein L6 [Candidatus Margulisiibacteriota bacterium]
MGRIGKRALAIPAGVEVKIDNGQIQVKGPKGTLVQALRPQVAVKVEDKKLLTVCTTEERLAQAMQGMYNALIKNMFTGVTTGFQKDLDLVGVGYRAQMQGKKLQLQLGFSHPVEFEPPAGVEFAVQGNTRVIIKGADRQVVGQIAAEIRQTREVEPYKGKGIKYLGEIVRRKAGKAAKAAGTGGGS